MRIACKRASPSSLSTDRQVGLIQSVRPLSARTAPNLAYPLSKLGRLPHRLRFATRGLISDSTMGYSDQDILARLEKLSISQPETVQHGPVKNGSEWKAELGKQGKVVLVTKTVG